MAGTYFRLSTRGGDAWTFRSDPATGGPWSPQLQHGGPPNALLVHVAEQVAAEHTGRSDLVALRTAAEFVGPVPVADVTVSARIVRAARTAVLVDTTLVAGGRDCLHARVWLVRSEQIEHGRPEPGRPPGRSPVPPPDGLPEMAASFPYGESIEWRSVYGGLQKAGPALVWARSRLSSVAGHPLTGLQRAALVGDSASGISSELDWSVWSFLNVDLDVHLSRPMQGEWVLMDAVTTLGPTGSGLARAVVSDMTGMLGTTSQTLVVEPRRH